MLERWTYEDTPQAMLNVADRLAAARSMVLATQGRRFPEVVEIATAGMIQRPGGGNAQGRPGFFLFAVRCAPAKKKITPAESRYVQSASIMIK